MSSMKKTPLQQARERAKLTIAELARSAQVDRGNLWRIERVKARASLEAAEKLARVLGISEMEILYPERYENIQDHIDRPADSLDASRIRPLAEQVA